VKVLFPAVTCVLVSHLKPSLGEAIDSVLAQTRKDFQLIVADSGQWIGKDSELADTMRGFYEKYSGHPLVEWITTGERADLHEVACPISYITNQVIKARLIKGKYMCTFYDDDMYELTFFEKMVGYLDDNPTCQAVYCAENIYAVNADGSFRQTGGLAADAPRSGAGNFDCRMDGASIMWHTSVLDRMAEPWLPEDPDYNTCSHSDGIFLEKLGAAVGTVHNIPEPLVKNRATPWSTFTPSTGRRPGYDVRRA
jgi:hypothetical protein